MLDLDAKAIVGLAESERISKEETKVHLEKFTKEDLINHIISDACGSNEDKSEELDDGDY